MNFSVEFQKTRKSRQPKFRDHSEDWPINHKLTEKNDEFLHLDRYSLSHSRISPPPGDVKVKNIVSPEITTFSQF